MRKRSRLLEVTTVCVATIAMASSAHATVSMPDFNVMTLEGSTAPTAALPIIRGGFGGTAEAYGIAHG